MKGMGVHILKQFPQRSQRYMVKVCTMKLINTNDETQNHEYYRKLEMCIERSPLTNFLFVKVG